MMSLRGLSFALAMTLLFATSSRAGYFNSPLDDSSVCGEVAVVDGLSDPNSFVGTPNCDSLCKKAAATCEKYVRKVLSCYSSWFKDSAFFERKNCDLYEPAEARRLCKEGVKQGLDGIGAKVDAARANGLSQCGSWGIECRMDCAAP